jgi:hypothetical protein
MNRKYRYIYLVKKVDPIQFHNICIFFQEDSNTFKKKKTRIQKKKRNFHLPNCGKQGDDRHILLELLSFMFLVQ